MKISTDDAAAIYARMCHARYGNHATNVVKDKIREMQNLGDASGSVILTPRVSCSPCERPQSSCLPALRTLLRSAEDDSMINVELVYAGARLGL
jgi:hypothetical protein